MKNFSKIHLNLFFILITSLSLAQTNQSKEKISKSLHEYFSLERENIHLHLNKDVYLSTEQVWFKGYVYNRKDKVPFFYTTNVYVALYDENGIKMSNKLLYSNSGSFSGKFELGKSFKTGKYYIHVFTNWMNNFKEDESSTYEINVINKDDTIFSLPYQINYSEINVDFFPEGGSIIENITNSIGVQISDCNGNPVPVSEIEIIDSQGSTLQRIAINKFGFGKFQLLADGRTYKTSFQINKKKVETYIPPAVSSGVSLEINSYAFNDKVIAKIKTNKKSIENFKGNPLFLVVHQDNKSVVLDIKIDNNNLEDTILFSKNNLFEGLNTIRIIDSNMNQIAERYIFKYPEKPLNLILNNPKKNNNKIFFSGAFSTPYSTASISVLPDETLATNPQLDIYNSLMINSFCIGKQIDVNYYFNEISKIKIYELDLMLLNQKTGKYKWTDITGPPPTITHDFDMGITLKGTINQTISDRKKYRVQLYSISSQLNEFTEINEKNEFYFKNLVVADSTLVNFSLVTSDEKAHPLKVYPQVLNTNRLFNKPFKIIKKTCDSTEKTEKLETPNLISETINLENVEIIVDPKKLKYNKQLGNSNLKGYKILDNDPNINLDLSNFLRNNGFDVERIRGEIQVYSRTSTLGNGKSSPAIFLANILQVDFNGLENMKMRDIDEIYINTHTTLPTSRSTVGIIKIYPKTGSLAPNKTNPIVEYRILNAFSKIDVFKGEDYSSTQNKGFQNFGIINWIPSIMTQENGEFNFEIPDMNLKRVKLLIEGFSADGSLISEIRTIDLP